MEFEKKIRFQDKLDPYRTSGDGRLVGARLNYDILKDLLCRYDPRTKMQDVIRREARFSLN